MNVALQNDVVVGMPPRVESMHALRGTVVLSCHAVFREVDRIDAYWAALEPAHQQILREASAWTWIPKQTVFAHYMVCEQIMPLARDAVKLGEDVGDKVQGVFIRNMMKALRGAGMTPWALLAQADKLLARLSQGAAIGVQRRGAKDAIVEFQGMPPASIPFFRNALLGVLNSAFAMTGSPRFFVRERGINPSLEGVRYSIQWV